MNSHEKHTPECHQISHIPCLKQKKTRKQANSRVPSSIKWDCLLCTPIVHLPKEAQYLILHHGTRDQHQANGLKFMPVLTYGRYLLFYLRHGSTFVMCQQIYNEVLTEKTY